MTEIAAGILVLIGAVFSLIASIGLIRMPDIFTRMHASTKAGAADFASGPSSPKARAAITRTAFCSSLSLWQAF